MDLAPPPKFPQEEFEALNPSGVVIRMARFGPPNLRNELVMIGIVTHGTQSFRRTQKFIHESYELQSTHWIYENAIFASKLFMKIIIHREWMEWIHDPCHLPKSCRLLALFLPVCWVVVPPSSDHKHHYNHLLTISCKGGTTKSNGSGKLP